MQLATELLKHPAYHHSIPLNRPPNITFIPAHAVNPSASSGGQLCCSLHQVKVKMDSRLRHWLFRGKILRVKAERVAGVLGWGVKPRSATQSRNTRKMFLA